MDTNPTFPPPSETTEVLHGNDNIIKKTLETFSSIRERMVGSIDNASPAIHIMPPVWTGLVQLKEKGVNIRVVTEITPDNITCCKKLMEACELRHLDGVRTNFAVADGKVALLHGVSQETAPLSQAILTSVKVLVEAQEYLFENLWKSAIPAQYKVKEIEEGVEPPFIDTLRDPAEIQKLGFQLVRSAKEEVLLLFSTANSFLRQARSGLVQLLTEIASARVKIRILTHINDDTRGVLDKLKSNEHIEARHLQESLQTRLTTLIVDRRFSLEVEVKDDTKNSSYEAVGLATYSNSECSVWTHASIFETLWIESELFSHKEA